MRVVTPAGGFDLGTTEVTPTISITDFSRRVTDDFGVTTVVKRDFSRRMAVRFAVPTVDVDELQRRLAGLRATAATWIADESIRWLNVQGFYKDFEVDLAVPPLSYCTLNVEGLAQTEAFPDPGGDPAPDGKVSSLKLLQPIAVTDAVLADSSVPEGDAGAWSAVLSYGVGDRVVRAHRVYESLIAANLGNDPAAAGAGWLDTGPTVRWAMFDDALGTVTHAIETLSVTLNAAGANAVALLDVVAASVRVQSNGYDRTIPVGSGAVTFLDLPAATGAVTVTLTGSGRVEVGTLLVGTLTGLGVTASAPTAGITDFSRKETDDFGNTDIVERAWAKRMNARALIRSDAVDQVANRIASVRARPSLWIADDNIDAIIAYGFFKDFSIEVGPNVSTLALSVEGLSKAPPQPRLTMDFIVGAAGNAAVRPHDYLHGLRQADGTPIATNYDRSYTVCQYDPRRRRWSSRSFDVFGQGEIDYGYGAGIGAGDANSGSDSGAMARHLNAIPAGNPVVVFSSDEPAQYRHQNGLLAAMYRCGASAAIFGGDGNAFPYRCAYILVGFAGAGEGNAALERVSERGVDNSPNAWLMTSFSIVNGVLQLGARDGSDGRDGTDGLPGAPGANGQTERTHYAYANSPDGRIDFTSDQPGTRAYEGSYVDFVEADSQDPARYTWREYKGPPFGMAARGGATIAGTQIVKRTDFNANWDSDAYSTVGFRGSAKMSCRFSDGSHSMAGLNTDPTADASFTSLDFAWYRENANMRIYESGAGGEVWAAASESRVFSVEYDGQTVTYAIDGVPQRQVYVGPDKIYYFDSSLNSPGGRILDVQFGPGAQRPAGLTLIPHVNAPRTITSANSVRAYGNNGGWGSGKAYSKEYYAGGAVAEWSRPAGSRGGDTMAGLAQAGGNSTSYDTITFALHQSQNGDTQAFINGIGWGQAGPTANPDVENRYKVHYDGRRFVRFYVNGVEIAGSAYEWGQQPDPLQFAAALASTNPAITDIAFSQAGQSGQNGSTGAPGAPGANGLTPITHYAYANSPNGQIDFATGVPGGRAYIGTYTDYTAADSQNPASYTWTQYKGPAAFGLVAGGSAAVAGNMLVSTAAGPWGHAGGYSTEGWRGGAQTSFKLATSDTIAGLNADPANGNSYETIDFSFHCSSDGSTYIYESGAQAQVIGGNDGNRTFQIVYDNRTVSYFINGGLVRQIAAPPNLTLFFDAAITGGAGNRVTDISFAATGTAGNDGSPGAPGAPGATGPGGPQGPGGAPGAPGSNGQDGYTAQLTAPTFTLPAFANGGLKPGALASVTGRFQVTRRDDQPVPAVTFSVAGQDGGTMSIDGNGNYALTSMDDSSAVARATVILRAQVAGVQPWDRAVVISKAPEGTPAYSRSSNGPTSTTSTTYTDGLIVTGPTTPNIGVAVSCNLTYRPTAASATLVGKLQYQINGGAWTDIANSEQTGSTGFPAPNDPGQISLSGFVPSSSIPANATIGVRSLFRRSIGGGQVDGNGTIAMNWRAN